MEIEIYRATDPRAHLPSELFWAMDGEDDRFIAAFDNYPDSLKYVVAAWGTTGGVDVYGRPIAALVATFGQIITGYVDLLVGNRYSPAHQEPSYRRRRRALLTALRRARKAEWLLVHDADEVIGWVEQGFRVVDPPPDILADEALRVLMWGSPPEDVYALMRTRGLSWDRNLHRYGCRRV